MVRETTPQATRNPEVPEELQEAISVEETAPQTAKSAQGPEQLQEATLVEETAPMVGMVGKWTTGQKREKNTRFSTFRRLPPVKKGRNPQGNNVSSRQGPIGPRKAPGGHFGRGNDASGRQERMVDRSV